MHDEDRRPKRTRFRFGLSSLFLLTLICCVGVFAVKWRNDRLIAKKREWLLAHGGGNAVLVEDGDVILVRNAQSCGAIIVSSQHIEPEKMDYEWRYRTDGDGMLFSDDPAVTSGSSTSGGPTSEINMHVGPFDLQWSGGDKGFGWFYFPEDSAVEFHVMRGRRLRKVDVMSNQWRFKSRKDRPQPAP